MSPFRLSLYFCRNWLVEGSKLTSGADRLADTFPETDGNCLIHRNWIGSAAICLFRRDALRHVALGRGTVQYGRCGCVWLYAAIACTGIMRSAPSSKPALSAQFLTSDVLACHREPVISARGSRARATRMASATRPSARRIRLMASSAEYGAGNLRHGPAGPGAPERAHGQREFFHAEQADRVIEQAPLRALWTRHAATVTGIRTAQLRHYGLGPGRVERMPAPASPAAADVSPPSRRGVLPVDDPPTSTAIPVCPLAAAATTRASSASWSRRAYGGSTGRPAPAEPTATGRCTSRANGSVSSATGRPAGGSRGISPTTT